MKDNTPFSGKLGVLTALLLILTTPAAHADPTASSTSFTLLPAETGAGGGRVANGGSTITADISVGDGIEGGISSVTTGGVQARSGFTGQLYDAVSMVLAPAAGTAVNEGDSLRLSALVTMDDGTRNEDAGPRWSILSGPITAIDRRGLASAGATARDASATVRALYETLSQDLPLLVRASPFAPYPLSWEDPAANGNGPYRIFLGTTPGNLVEVGSSAQSHFNPGQLAMGTDYWWRVLDASDNDLTPGGGPATFTTDLYRPDTRVGLGALPGSHIGNNVFNTSGAGQTVALKLKGKKPGNLYFSVENDGDVTDEQRFRAPRGSKTLGTVTYTRLNGPSPGNVTAAAITNGYQTGELAPGELALYRLSAKSKGKKKARQNLLLSTSSDLDTRGIDAGRGSLSVKPVKKKKK